MSVPLSPPVPVPPVASRLAGVASYQPLRVAARRLSECAVRALVVVRAGVVQGLLSEHDLLDPARVHANGLPVGRFTRGRGARIVWLGSRPSR